MIKAFWQQEQNVGDTLTPIIVEHFTGQKVELAERNDTGKLLAVGSIMTALRQGDTIWGAGVMHADTAYLKTAGDILAVRGKLTEERVGKCGVYGDPALLLPLIYNPNMEKKFEVGYIPHYADRPYFPKANPKFKVLDIDVRLPWQEFILSVLACKRVVSSSLHGIVIAEAYGIPATWLKLPGGRVLGGSFKFHDYLTGTGRDIQDPGDFPPIRNLEKIQTNLINALTQKYGKK